VPDVWALVLAGAISRPLLFGSGYGLARDMVFTPRQPLTAGALGLGSGLPRAAPLDAVLGLTARVADGTWVGRFAVFGVLVLAGCGAHRLVRQWALPARLLTAGLAVWNPFVIERLALGQWALLASYAALPWLVAALIRLPAASWRYRELAPVAGWLGLASLTPTGGVIGAVTALVLGGHRERRSLTLLLVLIVVTQAPWVLPSVLSTASVTSDPAAVTAFAARSERPGGPLLSLLGLGGIWDGGSTPSSRTGALGYLTTVGVVAVLTLGWPLAVRALVPAARRFTVLAAGAFVVAAASGVPGGRSTVRWLVDTVPGGGLFRDAQKWLIPFVLFAVLCAGAAMQRLHAAVRARGGAAVAPILVGAAVLPLLLLPDALGATHNTLTPVRYPRDFARVAQVVNDHGAVLTVPVSAYRRFAWGRPLAVADPAPQWFDTRVIVSDELIVGANRLAGEDPVIARISGELVAGRTLVQAAADVGIRWLVVYRDAAGIPSLSGLLPTYAGPDLAVYRVPGTVRATAAAPAPAAVAAVVVVDVLALGIVVLSAALRVPWSAWACKVGSRSPVPKE
jgi:hypothetical protein